MTRISFESTSSPFLLLATVYNHIDNTGPEDEKLTVSLKKLFYVDHLLIGVHTFIEALDVYESRSQS